MGTVGIDSSSINSSDVYSGGGVGERVSGRASQILREIFRQNFASAKTGFAKCADSAPRDVVANRLQCVRIFNYAAAAQHAVGDFLHPKRAFPAGCALAAALMRIKLVDVVQRPNQGSRSWPRTAEVMVREPGLRTPRIDMHRCSHSTTTMTPCTFRCSRARRRSGWSGAPGPAGAGRTGRRGGRSWTGR